MQPADNHYAVCIVRYRSRYAVESVSVVVKVLAFCSVSVGAPVIPLTLSRILVDRSVAGVFGNRRGSLGGVGL